MTAAERDGSVMNLGRAVLRPREQVEQRIKSAILSGELKSGDMLPPETELARQFGVSRTTLREALRVLTSQRLITKTPGAHGGNFVQRVDPESLGAVVVETVDNLLAMGTVGFGEVADVRRHLEVPSVRAAAEARSKEDLMTLRQIVDKQRTASVDDSEIPDLDRRFHSAIAKASGNRVLASFVAALHHCTEPVHYLDLSPDVGRETVKQHVRILKAIEAQDPAAGEIAIVEHLNYLQRHISASIEERNQNDA